MFGAEYKRVAAVIDLDALAHNIKFIKRMAYETKIMAIIKADGYGHGALETAKVLLYNGADCLGVAILDEALELRQNNIHVPILILGYTPLESAEIAIKNNLIQTVFSYQMAEAISKAAERINALAEVHIKIDTGMGRIGFKCNEADELKKIYSLPGLKISGIYSHLASADEEDDSFTDSQIQSFLNIASGVETKHISNSAGFLKGKNLDMARVGIILYGLAPSKQVSCKELKPVMSLKTHVTHIKEVAKGSTIGYGRTFTANRTTRIATIPVGYADGYLRALSNKGRVLIKGCFAPITGRICMDQFMVDVTDIDEVAVDDEVILFGSQGQNSISVDEIADICSTINYEIVCLIGKRVPRLYYKNGSLLKTVSVI